ncbi:hypothetical protein DL93DRAFT_2087420 [Clavulina sp. PMI_390]|nr:hypothetical protein DL93DRAFT_2087420 [Clavulina sp. PMI_390]
MGCIPSKSGGAHSGGHTVLSGSDPASPSRGPANQSDPRAAAAAAAERRAKESQNRGVSKNGVKGGALAKKLVETNRAIDQRRPEEQIPERVVYD